MNITVAKKYRKRNHGFYIPVASYTNRILKLQTAKKELENAVFTEKDLRGLSKNEKDFIRENDMKKTYKDFYMFIEKNLSTGKEQLYAYHKLQSLFPNGHDISSEFNNVDCWLIFNATAKNSYYKDFFDKNHFEKRFCQTPSSSAHKLLCAN